MGLATIAQLAPFQRSTNVFATPRGLFMMRLLAVLPTAVQFVAAGHDTLTRSLAGTALELGLGTIAQLTPFQRSTNVFATVKSLSPAYPTAVQLVVVGHDTRLRKLVGSAVGLGLGTIAQLTPFQRSTNVVSTVSLL